MKLISFFSFLLISTICYSQNSSIKSYLSKDTSLAKYIEANFYSDNERDTCYTGIHFIEIEFLKKDSLGIIISPQLKYQYFGRIKKLVQNFRDIFWKPEFINYCKSNNKTVIQPVLFNISGNCIIFDTTLHMKDRSGMLTDTTGKAMYQFAADFLIRQKFSLINSFKEVMIRNY